MAREKRGGKGELKNEASVERGKELRVHKCERERRRRRRRKELTRNGEDTQGEKNKRLREKKKRWKGLERMEGGNRRDTQL